MGRPPRKRKAFLTASKILSSLSRWPLLSAYCLFLYILFTLPPEELPPVVFEFNDKFLHFLDFFLLNLLALRTFSLSPRPLFHARAGWKAAFFSLSYGAFLEWVQLAAPRREASVLDWLADAAGVFLAVGFSFLSSRLKKFH